MDDVRLDRGQYWHEIPLEIQRRIEAGVAQIRDLRRSIAAAAKVRYFPEVVVDPAVWSPGGGMIVHAASVLCPDSYGSVSIGVILGAGPALCRDQSLVRAILVHEFAHCFKLATLVINHLDLGTPLDAVEGDGTDAEREDRLLLGAPDEWFGEADADLLRWGDERVEPITREVTEHVAAGRLPGTQPPIAVRGRFIVPPEWAARIRMLEGRA